jgi:DNA modification methylase
VDVPTVTLFVNDSDFQLYVGDVREQLRQLPDESVHTVVTSPPYWGLRDYGTGAWDGGDPDCDHVERIGGKQGGTGNTLGRDASHPNRESLPATGHALIETQYRDLCGKCGATRVDQQLGLEPTPELFVANMVDVFREIRRVLRRDGTCFVNLGDSYASGEVGRADAPNKAPGLAATQAARADRRIKQQTGLKPKDLVGIPWRVAFALQADGWYLRSDIVWSKPNPMPESVTDRPTKAHEYVFLLTRSPRYFFDQEAVREKWEEGWKGRLDVGQQSAGRRGFGTGSYSQKARSGPDGRRKTTVKGADGSIQHRDGERWPNGGRNIRSVWEIPTQPYPEAHFATFPEALPERCIKAGTSERGCCPVCGAPWERVTESDRRHANGDAPSPTWANDGERKLTATGRRNDVSTSVTTVGWRPSCDCPYASLDDSQSFDEWGDFRQPIPCTVLDPFMGSGTVALVARRLGRRSIGVELNPEYARLCARRLQQLSLFAGDPA